MKKKLLFSAMMAFAGLAVAQIPQNGLIAHFNMNGSAGYTSNVKGNAISPQNYTADSRSGGQLYPVPTPDRYNLADSASMIKYTSYQYELADVSSTKNSKLKIKKEISFGGWYMLSGYDNFNMSPLMFGVMGPTYGSYCFQGNINNGNIYMMMSSNTTNNQLIGYNISSDGSDGIDYFRHVMGTLSSDDTMRFYFQGKLVGKKKFVGDSIQYWDYANNKKYFSIGAQYTSNGWNGTGFNGAVDDIVIYDRALSASEIWTMFNNSSKCTNANAAKAGHLLRKVTNQLTVPDTITWHRDNCEFEWYANNNYGFTTKLASGSTIAISQNATYKVKVVHRATRCWYWTNDIVVTDLATNAVNNAVLNEGVVYPNPVNDQLHITGIVGLQNISVFASNGQQIFETSNTAETTINTAQWPAGMYWVKLQTNHGISTHKIVKN